jgi:hypothetical protein
MGLKISQKTLNKGKSHIFLKICLVLIFFIFSGLLFLSENDISPRVMAQSDVEYVGPESCQSCHPVQYSEWSKTNHSQAYTDPIFREQWEEKDRPGECLECHTTGYDLETETFQFEGVTCEICHGPGNTMSINSSSALCQQCHTGTRARQIDLGTHGSGGVTCVNCHMYKQSHTFRPRAEACAQCHTESDIHVRSEIPDLRSQVSGLEHQITPLEANITQLMEQLEQQKLIVNKVENTYSYLVYGGFVAAVLVVGGVIWFIWRRPI